ncbi:hypothetical protein ONZ43_g2474 [Nemania bipapillata]|uniref:Uncharacterized protein n=1 Tax=Nemania bipapillata TaxID=110536 RepID=A0ACC2J0H0_9PEZI|nr:hypothetical protein ONZ43_g2474 [Nemania bipapillata]
MSIDKEEHCQENSEESVASSPENGTEPTPAPQDAQPVKRKGGRKPIYATSEERKQRNRQAQAAFRERPHRNAAEECLMLRYKNSLLERILLEKGIDVQAELQAKTGSPNLGPTHMPQNMMQPPPIQRAILNRHHNSRRPASSIAPKLEPGVTSVPAQLSIQPSQQQQQQQHLHQQHHQATSGPRPPSIYPTSSFQSHFQQLGNTEQEYDATTDMMDEADTETPSQNPYASSYAAPQPNISMHPPTGAPSGQPPASSPDHAGQTQGQNYPSMTQLLDPALDWDPFGLSASMAFPTQFSFDTSNMR